MVNKSFVCVAMTSVTPTMGKNETLVSDQIRAYLESKGFVVFRMQAGRARVQGSWITLNPNGTPDLLAIELGTGRACFFETKTAEGKASEIQRRVVRGLQERGAFAMIAFSLGDVINALSYEN